MKLEIKPEEYGSEYAGTYDIKVLTTSEATEAFKKVLSKDKIGYINALVTAATIGPRGQLSMKQLQELPYQLYRRLMDKVLDLNENREEETNFMPNLDSEAPQSRPL